MKALSVKQPWAHAIVKGWKDVENRSRRTKHRGWLVIHASGSPNEEARYPRGWKTPDLETLPNSVIVGVVWLEGVIKPHRSPWYYPPNHAWVLEKPKRLRIPIQQKGKLGVWDVPASVARRIRAQLPKVNFKLRHPDADGGRRPRRA